MSDSHIVSVTFKAKSMHVIAFEAVMQSVKTDLPKVNGCLGVRVFQLTENEASFTLIEDWENAELHTAHIDGLIASGAWAGIEKMLSEPPVTLILKAL